VSSADAQLSDDAYAAMSRAYDGFWETIDQLGSDDDVATLKRLRDDCPSAVRIAFMGGWIQAMRFVGQATVRYGGLYEEDLF
jgi:hypothetical protein